jgi:hypothetical protein
MVCSVKYLVNQHSNINRTIKIIGDEKLVEFIAVQDIFSPVGKICRLVLPACTCSKLGSGRRLEIRGRSIPDTADC